MVGRTVDVSLENPPSPAPPQPGQLWLVVVVGGGLLPDYEPFPPAATARGPSSSCSSRGQASTDENALLSVARSSGRMRNEGCCPRGASSDPVHECLLIRGLAARRWLRRCRCEEFLLLRDNDLYPSMADQSPRSC